MQATRPLSIALVLLLSLVVLGASGGGVVDAGEPPLADAGLDQRVERNATVLLDAAGSRDPDGTIQSYRWTIETPDGRTIRPADADAPRTAFVARQVGRYEVTVTVTDDDGQSASDTLYVDVDPGADTDETTAAAPANPVDTTPGLPADASPDSDGTFDPAAPDAPLASGGEPSGDDASSDSTTTACANGTARVGDLGCLRGEDPPATVDISGDLFVRQGTVHTYTATVSDRPGGNERLSWSGGIGTGNTLTRVFTQPPGSTVRIAATVDDGEGHTSSDAIVVHVVTDNAPPEVRIEGPAAACVGVPVELEGYALASEPHDEVVDATWHGDPTFVPQRPGQYVVGFSARDKQGQTARTQHTVQVRSERVCKPQTSELSNQPAGKDKLLIRAEDDNWVVTSESSEVLQARDKVPETGPIERLGDIGASIGQVGEGAAEHVAGNEETLVFYMSAENASEVGEKIRATPDDDMVAGANGPRINEHERLKQARVEDRVETDRGRVKVVIRIGKDNTGNPDRFTDETVSSTDSAPTSGENSETQSSGSSSDTEATQELASDEQQTNVDNDPGVVDTVTDVTDSIGDAVTDAGNSLLSDGSPEERSSDGETDSTSNIGGSSRDDSAEAATDSGSDGPDGSDSGTSNGVTVPDLDGIVDSAVDESDGVSDGSSGSDEDPSIDGSGDWGGII